MASIQHLKEVNKQASKDILSLDWVLSCFDVNFPKYTIINVTPFLFTLGSNNHNEGLDTVMEIEHSLFFGRLQLDVNPNGNTFAADNISLIIESWFNPKPFNRHLNRIIEIQNYLNEQTERVEFFRRAELTSLSPLYDSYLSFVGFKLDYNGR